MPHIPKPPIRLLEREPNLRGDMFTRLGGDLLTALGYEVVRTDLARSGREIDLIAAHRTEPRRAVAECKATSKPIGGRELNTFRGSLALERDASEDEMKTTGYFISLAGFTDSAREQESMASDPLILLDGRQLLDELVRGGMLVSERDAIAAASASLPAGDLRLLDSSEVLSSRLGLTWCLYYGTELVPTHYALVHASGTLLRSATALEVVTADERCGGALAGLTLVAAPDEQPDRAEVRATLSEYYKYLRQEFGYITLEGLPADGELSVRRIELEDLYVPLTLIGFDDSRSDAVVALEDEPVEIDVSFRRHWQVVEVLEAHQHVAITAVPGGGKSTLLKYLVTELSKDLRRATDSNADPNEVSLPVILRCRQLDGIGDPLVRVMQSVPDRGEFPHLKRQFDHLLQHALLDGRLQVLVDGLDEIADDRARASFVAQLRTFCSIYPDVRVVVTSRPSGYRAIAGLLDSVCTPFQIADFDDDDIMALTEQWHRAVVGDSALVQSEAVGLAERIITTDRVRRLATNPLLLTTLLLVKRWVGELPRRRSVLYERAIEVLLRTWNVEGHEPIELDEALPQLAYVAYEMTASETQTISEPRLKRLLQEARNAMPAVLGYTDVSVGEFVRRIEHRSSVLSLTGHADEGGRMVPQYEFKHLTFQEYLTALAVSDSYCRPRLERTTIVETIADQVDRSNWVEIVPLVVVLAKRDSEPLMRHLIERCDAIADDKRPRDSLVPQVLAQCLADEVQISPQLAREACAAIGPKYRWFEASGIGGAILASRFGPILREVCEEAFFSHPDDLHRVAGIMGEIAWDALVGEPLDDAPLNAVTRRKIESSLAADDARRKSLGCLAIMSAAFATDREEASRGSDIAQWLMSRAEQIARWLDDKNRALAFSATWALAWLGSKDLIPSATRPSVLRHTLASWRSPDLPPQQQAMAAWTFSVVPLIARKEAGLDPADTALLAFLREQFASSHSSDTREDRRPAALLAGYYLGGPWSDSEIVARCDELDSRLTADRLKSALQ